jgi:type IV pilus assembly protein PilE
MARTCSSAHSALARRVHGRGFTIIELMIVVLIIGVLLALAYPSFTEQMRKSRRADGISALMSIQQAQERWRGNNPSYIATFNTAVPPAAPNGLSAPSVTASGYYTLGITVPAAPASSFEYVLLASAVAGKSQTLDGSCKVIGIRASSGRLQYGSATSSIDWNAAEPDNGRCWAR